jgi:heme exporter protein C
MKYWTSLLALATAALLGYGFYQAMYVAPTDEAQGEIYRVIYYHVPSGWCFLLCFFANFIASVWYLLVRRDPSVAPAVDAYALATAEVGVVFCTVSLITGPLWAKPVWGIWWTWDARLTSTLVIWLIYVSYLITRRMAQGEQTPIVAAILAIFGFVDVPIVWMSIRWWRTQHPQPVIGGAPGSGLDPRMWHALWINWLAFSMLGVLWIFLRQQIRCAELELHQAEILKVLDASVQEVG